MEDKDKEGEESCWLWVDELNEDIGKFEVHVFEEPGEREKEGKIQKGNLEVGSKGGLRGDVSILTLESK